MDATQLASYLGAGVGLEAMLEPLVMPYVKNDTVKRAVPMVAGVAGMMAANMAQGQPWILALTNALAPGAIIGGTALGVHGTGVGSAKTAATPPVPGA